VSGEGELSVVVVALEGDSGGGFESPAVWASGGGAVVFEVAKGESQSLVVDAQYFSQGDSRERFVRVSQGETYGLGEGDVAVGIVGIACEFEMCIFAVIVGDEVELHGL